MYPNGAADVNHFHAAGGIGFLVRTLLDAGLLHEDVETIVGRGLRRYTEEPVLANGMLTWRPGPAESLDLDVLRPASAPFSADGGVKVVRGPLGTGVVKTSAVAPEHRRISAPARVFDDQHDFLLAFSDGETRRDRPGGGDPLPGPGRQRDARACTRSTPALGVLQDRGRQVAIVTDGRMSGASGKVPAAIHVTPEAALGGPLSRVRDGDVITLDADAGTLTIDAESLRPHTVRRRSLRRGVGRHRPRACSRPSARPSAPPTRARPSSPSSPPPRRCPLSAPEHTDVVLDLVPVLPVVVIDDLAHAVPVARALVDGGLPAIEPDPAHAGGPGRDAADRRRGARDRPRRRHHHQPRPGGGGGGRRRPLPGLPGLDARAAGRDGRDRGALPARHLDGLGGAGRAGSGAHRDEVLPGGGGRRCAVPEVGGGSAPPGPVLPDRRDHPGLRARLPRTPERRLRRRLLAHPGRRPGLRGLGADQQGWPRRRRLCAESGAAAQQREQAR
nr:dihydroxy-acid dehydratase [Nocardioides convexus]